MSMSPDDFRMMQAISQGGGMFGNIAEPNYFPFGNSGLFGGNPMLGMAAQQLLPSMFGSQGMFLGQFAPTQNLYDQFRARQYQNERLAALMAGGQGDRQTYVRMMRGVAQMSGTPFGLEQLRAANTIAGDAANIMPLLAPMAPEFFDQLHGTRGSQAIMAMMLHRGGYSAVDPITGLSGLSGASSGYFAKEMYSRLYGPGVDISPMRGLGAGVAGSMYAELQNRGLMGPAVGTMNLSEQAKVLGMTEKQLNELGSPRLDEVRRQFDARQAADRIKNLAGAVSAMRDIFGDMGHPDAPMAQLISTLNNLTQGGLATMAPGRLEQTVRHAYEVAKQTGVGMPAFLGLTAGGAQLTQQFGLDQSFALQASQGAVTFGAAYGDVGGAQHAAFGRGSRDSYTLKDQRLRTAAAASGMANQYGALFRIESEVGGLKGPAKELLEAIRRGDDTFQMGGVRRSTYLEQNELIPILQASGIDANTATNFLRDRHANQAYVFQHKLGEYVRRTGQPKEVKDYFAMHFQAAIAGQLANLGIGGDQARQLADKAARTASDQLLSLDAETMADSTKRTAAIGQIIQDTIGKQVPLTKEQVNTMASLGWSKIDTGANNGEMKGYESAIQMYDLNNPRTLARAKRREDEARIDAAMGKALSGLGRSGPLARFADMLQNPPGSAGEALGKFLGGVPVAELEKRLDGLMAAGGLGAAQAKDPERLMGMLQALTTTQAAFRDAKARGASPAELQTLADETTTLISGGPEAENHIKRILANEGLSREELDEVLAGNRPQVSQETRNRLRGLQLAGTKGIASAAGDMGIAVGSPIGAQEVADARQAGGRLGVLMRKGKLTDKELADAKRYAGRSINEGWRIADLALGNEGALKAAGRGGLERAKAVRQTLVEMRALAAEKGGGKTVEEILATGDPKDPHVQELRKMHEKFQNQLGALHFGFERGDKLSDEEVKAGAKYREEHGKDSAAQLEENKKLLRDAIKASGGHLSDQETEKLAKEMGSGAQGEISRSRLQKALKLRKEYEERVAKDRGYENSKEGKAQFAAIGAFGRIGTGSAGMEGVGETVTADSLRAFITEGKEGPKDDTGKKGETKISGRVVLEDPHHLLVHATTDSGTGSTPVAMGS